VGRRIIAGMVPLLVAAAIPPAASGQDAAAFVVGGGVGGTYYCITTRCNQGTVLAGIAAIGVGRFVQLEAGVRRHFCFDCDRFMIGEGTVLVRLPDRTLSPFAGAGFGVSSDPEFMGSRWGVNAAAGTWIWPLPRWGLQLSIRGRSVGRGEAIGEAAVIVGHRFRARS
jgi:hypothetical protein